jgi:hypothetical protein
MLTLLFKKLSLLFMHIRPYSYKRLLEVFVAGIEKGKQDAYADMALKAQERLNRLTKKTIVN